MMTRDECIGLIVEIYAEFVPAEENAAPVGPDTRLFGGDRPLDSTALVSLVVEVEQQVNERCGSAIVIADDRAMSQTRSPFRSVESLADYIQTLLAK